MSVGWALQMLLEFPDVPWQVRDRVQLVDKAGRRNKTGNLADDPSIVRIVDRGIEEQNRGITQDVSLILLDKRPAFAVLGVDFHRHERRMASATAGLWETSESSRLHQLQVSV